MEPFLLLVPLGEMHAWPDAGSALIMNGLSGRWLSAGRVVPFEAAIVALPAVDGFGVDEHGFFRVAVWAGGRLEGGWFFF